MSWQTDRRSAYRWTRSPFAALRQPQALQLALFTFVKVCVKLATIARDTANSHSDSTAAGVLVSLKLAVPHRHLQVLLMLASNLRTLRLRQVGEKLPRQVFPLVQCTLSVTYDQYMSSCHPYLQKWQRTESSYQGTQHKQQQTLEDASSKHVSKVSDPANDAGSVTIKATSPSDCSIVRAGQ